MDSAQAILGDASPSSTGSRPAPVLPRAQSTSNGHSGLSSPDSTIQKAQTPARDAQSSPEALEDALSSLSLDSTTMFRALASIFQAAHLHEASIDLQRLTDGRDTWAVLRRGDELESQGVRDIPSLAAVKDILDKVLASASNLLLPALRIIADGSRDASWRIPLGESEILDFALRTVSSSEVPHQMQIQALRLIGNTCADTNENRERVVSKGSVPIILRKIRIPPLAGVAVPVLYNVCCEYEPAQVEAVKAGLYTTLIITIETGILDGAPALGYLCRMLDLGLKHLDASKSPENAVELLLQCAIKPDLDVDDSIALVDCAVAHLELERFQKHMLEQDLFGVPLRYLVRSYFPKATLSGTRIPSVEGFSRPAPRDPDEEAELSRTRKALIQALSDVSALPEFSERHASLATPLVDSLASWITAALPQIQLCSCIVLGNLARDDNTCTAMVARLGIHKGLISIARTSPDTTVIHATLSFLRNLALPLENKRILGDRGLIDALTRFWSSDFMPQIAHAAAAVGRQLIIGCMPNVERLMTPLSTDTESPAHDRTYLSLLLALFERTDEAAVKMEIARTVAGILRCISSATSIDVASTNEVLQRLYSRHHNIGLPLGTMVTQTQFPVIRSEGWFAMALMSRHPQGAVLVGQVVADVSVFTSLELAVSGRAPESESSSATPVTDPNTPMSSSQPSRPEEMKAKDRDNAMILINQLLQHMDRDLISNIRRSALEELLYMGAQL